MFSSTLWISFSIGITGLFLLYILIYLLKKYSQKEEKRAKLLKEQYWYEIFYTFFTFLFVIGGIVQGHGLIFTFYPLLINSLFLLFISGGWLTVGLFYCFFAYKRKRVIFYTIGVGLIFIGINFLGICLSRVIMLPKVILLTFNILGLGLLIYSIIKQIEDITWIRLNNKFNR